jgi:hypothetical protein
MVEEKKSLEGYQIVWSKKGEKQIKKDRDFHYAGSIEYKCPTCGYKAYVCYSENSTYALHPITKAVFTEIFGKRMPGMLVKMHSAYFDQGKKAHSRFIKDFGDIFDRKDMEEKIKL